METPVSASMTSLTLPAMTARRNSVRSSGGAAAEGSGDCGGSAGRVGGGDSPSSPSQRRPYWSGREPQPQKAIGASGMIPSSSNGSTRPMTVHAWVQSSPKSKTYVNFDPDLTRRATTDDSSAVRGMVLVHAEDRSSSAISSSTTAVPSSRVNCLRWDRSHRARATSIACPRSSNVAPGGTTKFRPGGGSNTSPRPCSSSTRMVSQRRVMRSTLSASTAGRRLGPPRRRAGVVHSQGHAQVAGGPGAVSREPVARTRELHAGESSGVSIPKAL